MRNRRWRWHILEDLININRYRYIAEIGVWHGRLSRHIVRKCKTIKECWAVDGWRVVNDRSKMSRLRSLEEWDEVYFTLLKSTLRWRKLNLVRLPSKKASELFEDNFFDLVFIDADHRYDFVSKDIDLWYPKVKNSGYICGHDYSLQLKNLDWGVNKAVLERFKNQFEVLSDGVWVHKKWN